ncbi:MAG: biopolymer transporter ExbD [Rhodobacteraceae bacterium]|nr:biopolymer transporter ExbD [Paracoccaceae bacterium]
MRIDIPQPRARKLSMTSLIDVIFLLLLFFMLSSTFTRFAEVEVALPGSAGTGSTKSPDIFMSVEKGNWRINGAPISPDEATDRLTALQEKGAKSLFLIPEGDETDAQDLVSAIETIHRIDGLKLTIAR